MKLRQTIQYFNVDIDIVVSDSRVCSLHHKHGLIIIMQYPSTTHIIIIIIIHMHIYIHYLYIGMSYINVNKIYKYYQLARIDSKQSMDSPHSTANFNFSNIKNDGQFLNPTDNRMSDRQFSLGQPNPSITTGYAAQPANTGYTNHMSFGYPIGQAQKGNGVINARATHDPSMNVRAVNTAPLNIPQTYKPAQPQPVSISLPVPQQVPVSTNININTNTNVNTGHTGNTKMAVMHRPDIYSINADKMGMNINGSLQTIQQQRSSVGQSIGQSQNLIRSTQGYNISTTQKQEYQRERKLQEDASCCFCFKKKK